jgi:hypothetical protein
MLKPDDNRTQTKSKTNTKQNPVKHGDPPRQPTPQGSAKRAPSGRNAPNANASAKSYTAKQAPKQSPGNKITAGNHTAKAPVNAGVKETAKAASKQGAAGFLQAQTNSVCKVLHRHADLTHRHDESESFSQAGKHDALVPATVIGALLGMLAGTLPPALWVLIFGVSFPPLYLLPPLAIWLGIRVFKGHTGLHGVVVTTVFSIAGFYLTLLSCQAADHILRFRMSAFNLPLVTAAMIGRSGALPGPAFSAAYVYPAVFAIIGLVLACELHLRGIIKN